MSTVSWNARDQLGRVIEVTSDTVADVPSPGPESLAVGGEQTIRLLKGTLHFDDVPFEVGAGFNRYHISGDAGEVTFDRGQLVIRSFAIVTTAFAGTGTSFAECQIQVHAADPVSETEQWNPIENVSSLTEHTLSDQNMLAYGWPRKWFVTAGAADEGGRVQQIRLEPVTSTAHLAVELYFDGTLTAGEADIYALIAEPAG